MIDETIPLPPHREFMPSNPSKIVVLDESPLIAWGLLRYFESEFPHCRVESLASLAQLGDHLGAAADADVVITGPSFADMSSCKAVRRFLMRHKTTRWLAIGDQGCRSGMLDFKAVGANGFVSKNASMSVLANALHEVHSGTAWFTADSAEGSGACQFRAPAAGTQGLTPRQEQIYCLVARGHSNKKIAQMLDISESTVKEHMTRIFGKLGVSSRAQAIAKLQL
jgi:DNA-binding NarL/FixJ family response regulator